MSAKFFISCFNSLVGTFIVTRLIDLLDFPLNYSIMFLVLSLGGFFSYYFSSRISVPDQTPPPFAGGASPREGIRNYLALGRSNPKFVSFASKRFVYFSALALSLPIVPLYFVREVHAADSQIGAITMVMNLVMLAGYYVWPRVSRLRGGRTVLLATTLGMTFYPALIASTTRVNLIILFAGAAGFFAGGLDPHQRSL